MKNSKPVRRVDMASTTTYTHIVDGDKLKEFNAVLHSGSQQTGTFTLSFAAGEYFLDTTAVPSEEDPTGWVDAVLFDKNGHEVHTLSDVRDELLGLYVFYLSGEELVVSLIADA
jgi:hypothetical protein